MTVARVKTYTDEVKVPEEHIDAFVPDFVPQFRSADIGMQNTAEHLLESCQVITQESQ